MKLWRNYIKEFPRNMQLAFPVMVSMIGHTLVQFVDNVMVGQLGTAELAAISLGNTLIYIAMSIGIGFSMAITPLVAEADAAGDHHSAKKILSHGVVWCFFLGLLLFLGVWFSKPILLFMGQPASVVILAMPYLQWVAVSLFPLILFQAFKQFTDGISKTRYAMYATLIGNIVNVIVNYLLIFGTFGFPKLGVVGAAIGTLISRIFMLVGLYFIVYAKPSLRFFVVQMGLLKLKKDRLFKLFQMGFPSALQMFFEVSFFVGAVFLSGLLGKNPQAANQIALNLSSMTFMVALGIGVAAMVRVGNQVGYKDVHALKRIALSNFMLIILLDSIFAIFFMIFHEDLPWLYLDNTTDFDVIEVVGIASKLMIVAAFFQIFDGMQAVTLGALRGLQDVKIPTWITFIAYGMVGFPISIYLGLFTTLEASGIWVGLLSGLVASSIMLYLRFNYKVKQLASLGF